MPAAARVTVQRHVVSLALLPGVTGRTDVLAGPREQLLAAVRPALERCLVAGSTVTVIAPALVSRTTTTAQPDLGASGYAAPRSSTAPAGPGADRATPDEPPLHVTASAAVSLVRLAGWAGEVTIHEVGASGIAWAPTADAPDISEPAGVTHLVVVACATPDGVLPVGASVVLAEAERQTHDLFRKVTASVAAAGLASDLASDLASSPT